MSNFIDSATATQNSEKRPKKERVKSLTEPEEIKKQIEFLEKYNIEFSVKLSNYTTVIETPSRIYSWNDHDLPIKAFIGYQMIKKDINEFTANERPEIDRMKLEFFDTYTEKNIHLPDALCIDIKSAYATILYLDGFITEKTYNFLSSLEKKARLAAVGMLASRKDVFYYKGRELTNSDKIVNPYENYFWYCVKRTNEVMSEIARNTKPLFYWVDGIYFANADDADRAEKILSGYGFKWSKKNCFMVEIKTTRTKKSDFINVISFYECKDLSIEYKNATKKDLSYKTFSIPLRRAIRKELINYLINKK